MTAKELINSIQIYIERYPRMADKAVVIVEQRKRRVKGDFYKRYKMSGIGFNGLVSNDNLTITIAPNE